MRSSSTGDDQTKNGPGATSVARRTCAIVTCEHGGNRIPVRYRRWFAGAGGLLRSHRGYDVGALAMARTMASALRADLFFANVSRLLVELNRSTTHRSLFSARMLRAPQSTRGEVLERFYVPYRTNVERVIARAVQRGALVVHISAHSFTPVMNGERRNADVGLLYDPTRPLEVALCRRWQHALRSRAPQLTVRRNYPYRGYADGFTTYLRGRFPWDRYVGIELEVNQRFPRASPIRWAAIRKTIAAALVDALSTSTSTASR